jgi:hypothetical protein
MSIDTGASSHQRQIFTPNSTRPMRNQRYNSAVLTKYGATNIIPDKKFSAQYNINAYDSHDKMTAF